MPGPLLSRHLARTSIRDAGAQVISQGRALSQSPRSNPFGVGCDSNSLKLYWGFRSAMQYEGCTLARTAGTLSVMAPVRATSGVPLSRPNVR